MRQAKAEDYWRKVKEINCNSYIADINFQGHNGILDMRCENGIQVVCGLNGAGKTTLISGIKDIIGIPLDKQGAMKVESATISGNIVVDGQSFFCKNEQGNRLVDKIDCSQKVGVLEYFQIFKTLDIFWNQENIDELVEQNEPIELGEGDLSEINYLVGREYSKISLVEIEDMNEIGTIPFFSVQSEGICYDSRRMGMGEYCLMYIYWYMQRAENNSIILIEEPESFIGIKSQKNLMNFVAKKTVENKISFIISTHSPFIIEKVSNKNIKVMSRAVGRVAIRRPEAKQANIILGSEENLKGTLLVEDEMAHDFLHILLRREDTDIFRNYSIRIAGSSGEITKVMKVETLQKIDYSVFGIYDDDQREEDLRKNKLLFTFLPPKKDVETAMKEMILEGSILERLSQGINKTVDDIIEAIAQVSGDDHHDWLKRFAQILDCPVYNMLDILYVIWREQNEELVMGFVKEIKNMIEAPRC